MVMALELIPQRQERPLPMLVIVSAADWPVETDQATGTAGHPWAGLGDPNRNAMFRLCFYVLKSS
jgi:hypothetical protein